MPYQVSREGQTYGPYTLEDLQRYVASGNVLLTDMAKADDASEWIPVAQVLSAAGAAVPPPAAPTYAAQPPAPAYAAAPYAAAAGMSPYPDPPNLHWALVLIIGICTCGIFFVIWDLVQVLWMKRVDPPTKAFGYFIAYAVLSLINGGVSTSMSAAIMAGARPHGAPLSYIISIAVFVLVILYRFSMKNSLEQHFNTAEPIGLRLGPIMTFFFGGLYFQYHFNRINQMKLAARYRSL